MLEMGNVNTIESENKTENKTENKIETEPHQKIGQELFSSNASLEIPPIATPETKSTQMDLKSVCSLKIRPRPTKGIASNH